MTAMLGFDPRRLDALARATKEAAAELAAVASDEPCAADAVGTAHAIAGELDGAVRWSLQSVLSSAAMTGWNGSGLLLSFDELLAMLGDGDWVAAPNSRAPAPFELDADDLPLAASVTATEPAQWFAMINPACVNFAGGDYHGGGYITDHRGERYPIVVPRVQTADGDVYSADAHPVDPGIQSVATLGGSDPGWQIVGTATGIARFQRRPSAIERFLGGVAATTGLVRPLPPNDGLRAIAVPLAGPPSFAHEPPPVPGPITSSESGGGVPDPANGSPLSVIGSTTGMALTVTQGVVMAAAMDNQTERAYRVLFERNADGRRRARICTYTLANDLEGDVVIVPEHVYVDGDGKLTSETISYGTLAERDDAYVAAGRDDVGPFAFTGDEPISYRVHSQAFP